MNEVFETYVYLAKRDKKGVRVLTNFKSQNHIPERLSVVSSLPLDIGVIKNLEQIVYDNRLHWEVWIQSAKNFEEFRQSLKKRGFSGIPVSPVPEVISSTIFVNRPNLKKSMIQRMN